MKNTLLTVGTFDGLHLGHRSLLKRAQGLARELHLELCAISFPHPPRAFFTEPTRPYLLSSPEEKKWLFKCEHVPLEILPFDWRLAEMNAEDFYADVLRKQFHARAILVGYNFRFGKDRSGNFERLGQWGKRDGIKVYQAEALNANGAPISSGRIREAIAENNLVLANALLGHKYFVIGPVVRGQGLGRKLGFPTANIGLYPYKLLPGGVYRVQVEILSPDGSAQKKYDGVANVGFRPSIAAAHAEPILEVHLLNFTGSLYHKPLRIIFEERLRDEKKFDTLEDLKHQIQSDITQVRNKIID